MGSFPVRSVGRIAENELPLPNGEVVGSRAKIACPKSPKKSGLKQEAECPPSVSSPSSYILIVEICLQLLRSFSKSLVQSLAHSIPPVYVLNEFGRFYGLYSV